MCVESICSEYRHAFKNHFVQNIWPCEDLAFSEVFILDRSIDRERERERNNAKYSTQSNVMVHRGWLISTESSWMDYLNCCNNFCRSPGLTSKLYIVVYREPTSFQLSLLERRMFRYLW